MMIRCEVKVRAQCITIMRRGGQINFKGFTEHLLGSKADDGITVTGMDPRPSALSIGKVGKVRSPDDKPTAVFLSVLSQKCMGQHGFFEPASHLPRARSTTRAGRACRAQRYPGLRR